MLKIENENCTLELRKPNMLNVDQISRNGNQFIRRLRIDNETLLELRRDRIGLLLEQFSGLESMLGRLLPLRDRNDLGTIVIVYASKMAGGHLYDEFANEGLVEPMKKTPATWRIGSLLFTSVEQLSRLKQSLGSETVQVIFVLDSMGMIHKARDFQLRNGRVHDRPSCVVDFLADISEEGLDPLLVVMTRQRAISLPTEQMARIYNRDAWYFCDGNSLAVRSAN
jgi:hypothetical protein